MLAVWQQVFALDAKFNAHRAPNHPNFRTLYIRRRNQLLREYAKGEESATRKQYLRIRAQLLQQRYGTSYDQTSLHSRSFSARSSSRVSVSESPDCVGGIGWESQDSNKEPLSEGVVPTKEAEASRAIVGGNTIAENYAFVGVHHIFDQHTAAVTMIKFANNDRSRLGCASFDGTLSVCNVTSNPPFVECIFRGHNNSVTGFDWSVANDLMVSCSIDGTICLWNVAAKSRLRSIKDPSGSEVLTCLFHPVNNNMVIAGNSRGTVEVLNISTGIYLRGGSCKLDGRVFTLAFEANGQLLWAGSSKGTITSFIFDLSTGKLSKCRKITLSEGSPITCISWRAWISREARDPTLLVNCAANVVCLFRVLDQEGSLKLKRRFFVRHKNNRCLVRSTFCPIMSFRQGACVVTGSEDSCVYFLDIEREIKPVVNKLQGHACPVLGVSFNYDESLLATSDYQGLVIVWSREKRLC
ncbi:WD repeat-containing protein 13-like [Lycorma delicatula]|uniref:WD repeat-containing protein 13-like n=1 Tax=Lycorma delicatula TaxID=130591 RepID=UPI003F5121F8